VTWGGVASVAGGTAAGAGLRGERLYRGAFFMLAVLAASSSKARYHVAGGLASALTTGRGLWPSSWVAVSRNRAIIGFGMRAVVLRKGLVLLSLGSWVCTAMAGRPLSTDDAGTADAGTCQVEAWHERSGPDRAFVLAPACGVVPGLEIGMDATWPSQRDVVRKGAGLALKVAPASWRWDSVAGELGLGLKFSGAWTKPAAGRWQGSSGLALGLASLKASETLTLHVNAGLARDSATAARATVANLALVWSPHASALLFAEAQGNSKKDVFGGTVATAGARWWLVKDSIGLDFTASRERGSGGPTRYTLGLGWYGIGS
jgi:hypothetical protein